MHSYMHSTSVVQVNVHIYIYRQCLKSNTNKVRCFCCLLLPAFHWHVLR